MKLVHHTDESRNGGASPFAEAIQELTASEQLSLACPYINVEYLRSALEHVSSWRLLTDAKAWLAGQNAGKRASIQEFVERHHESIHHVEDLHAKAIIGDGGALIGSANFTDKGLWKREELSVLLDDPENADELRAWFDGLWSSSDPVKLDELDAYIRTAPAAPSGASHHSTPSFTSNAPKVRASRATDESSGQQVSETVEDEDAHRRLVEQVGKAPNREWIDHHFELLREILSATDMSVHDPILFMSITKDGKLHTTINNRIVFGIQPFQNRTLFILPPDMDQIDQLITQAVHVDDFKEGGKNTPYLLGFNDGLKRVADSSFRRGWRRAALSEVDRGWDESPYRKKYTHEPVVYRAAVDHEYRERILDEAFGE
jgi:hypothetical protein